MRRKRLVIVGNEKGLEMLNCNRLNCSYASNLIQYVRRDDGSPWHSMELSEQIKFDALVAPDDKLTIPFTFSLIALSNITHLTLKFELVPNSTLTQVIRLIENLSDQLVDLKLSIFCFFDYDFEHEEVSQQSDDGKLAIAQNVIHLFACLNRLPSLQHLRMYLNFPDLNIRPPLSFLSRLTTLGIGVEGIQDDPFDLRMMGIILNNDWIISSLNEFAANVDSIYLYNTLLFDSELSQISDQLYTKINGLNVRRASYNEISLICTRFSSLTKLKLCQCSIPMTMLARCLTQLSQLVHLDLDFYPIPQVEPIQPGEDGEIRPLPEIAQVHSVRLLIVNFSFRSHLDTERLFISDIFPNLQVLRLRYFVLQCRVCEIASQQHGRVHNVENSEPELARRLTECTRLMRQPFRHCTNLHTIELASHVETLISADEL